VKLLWIFLFLLIGSTGCSVPSSPQTSIHVTMQENRFLPGAWRVAAGQQISVTLTNQDAIPHDWTILVGDTVLNPAAIQKPSVFWSFPSPAASEATITFQAPAAAGVYRVVCTSPGHPADAMQGRLTVVQPWPE
jgi:plastocyanin